MNKIKNKPEKKKKKAKKTATRNKTFTWWDWWALGPEGRKGVDDDYANLTRR